MSALAMPVRAPQPTLTESEKAHALRGWLSERLGEDFKVEIPATTSPCVDGLRRFYVRRGGRRAVVRVTAAFLTTWDCEEFSRCLLAGSPTVVDLIRAGALHIDVDAQGAASALYPPCR